MSDVPDRASTRSAGVGPALVTEKETQMRRLMALLVGVGSLVIAGAAGAEQTYTDGSGDSGTAPDLTQVVVSNDDAPVEPRT